MTDRPKRLLVFINPVSGNGKARETYTRKADPALEEANIETDVIGILFLLIKSKIV